MFTTDGEEIKPVQIELKCNIGDFVYILKDNKIYRKEVRRLVIFKEFNHYGCEILSKEYLIGEKLYKEDNFFTSKKEILQYIADNIIE